MSDDSIIRVRCPSCKRTAKAKEKVLGRQIACPRCKATVQFERAETPSSPTPSSPASPVTSKSTSQPTPEPRIRVQCPSCGSFLKAKQKVLGKKVKCPKCNESVRFERVYANEDELAADMAKKAVATGVSAAKKLFSFGKKKYEEHQERQRQRMEQERLAAQRRRPHFRGKGEILEVHGYTIQDPMIYVADVPAVANADAGLLCLRQPAARPRIEPDHSLGYWPRLSECAPHQIGNFLHWLANGKSDPDADLGYVFLYFYGLERRALIDGQDCDAIVNEVRRLLGIYRESRSFNGYATGLIRHLLLLGRIQNSGELIDWLLQSEGNRIDDELQAYILGSLAKREQPLPSEWAVMLAKQDERSKRSVVTERAKDEFEKLFALKYSERFGDGIVPAKGDRSVTFEYHPASPTLLNYDSSIPKATLPSVRGWKGKFRPAVKMYNECIEELKGFAKKAHAQGKDSVLAYESLPEELQSEAEHPRQAEWETLLDEFTPDEGPVLLPISRLAVMRDIKYREKLTLSQSKSIAEFCEGFDSSVEPDARFTRKGYEWNDHIAILRLPDDPKVPETQNYALTSLLMPLALEVSQASGNVEEEEQKVIQDFIEERFMLSRNESLRAGALIHVLLANGVSVKGIKSKIQKQFSNAQIEALGKFLVMIAAAADGICSAEVDALQKTFKAIGLSKTSVDEFIAEMGLQHPDQPILVDEGEEDGDAEVIPERGITLDYDRIIELKRMSKQATDTLLGAMSTDHMEGNGDTEVAEEEVQSPEPNSMSLPIPDKLQGFYADVLARSEWPQADLEELAQRHSTTYAAAVDQLNEIFMEHLGDPLLEEGEPLMVHPEAPKLEGGRA
jgi:DNA-directed RNA polymerase subunit M/transcription elongation factor TFIIS/tellurite resistance protein